MQEESGGVLSDEQLLNCETKLKVQLPVGKADVTALPQTLIGCLCGCFHDLTFV